MSNKRDRGSPTGQTPRQPQKKKASSRLHLHPSKPISKRSDSSKWTSEEERCLVKYLFMSGFVNTWPTTKAKHFWESAACAMKQEGFERTGGSCRVRALIRLAYVFGTPVMALEKLIPKPIEQGKSYSPIPIEYCTPSLSPVAITRHDRIQTDIPLNDLLSVASDFFTRYALERHGLYVPGDFIFLAMKSMLNLRETNRGNVIYGLCKGIGTKREDGQDSWLPAKRMPMGLLEFIAEFYTSGHNERVACPDDYMEWLKSMYCLFGTKWSKLHCGPMCSFESTEQGRCDRRKGFNPLTARVNIPAPVERTLRRSIERSNYSVSADIQEESLDQAHRLLPSTEWWIKADGVDLLPSLEESVSLKWNGDVDMADGQLQKLYSLYISRLNDIPSVSSLSAASISKLLSEVKNDLEDIYQRLGDANSEYATRLESGSTDKVLFNLGWKVDELSRLNKAGHSIMVELQALFDSITRGELSRSTTEVQSRVIKLAEMMTMYLRGLYRQLRTAATHALAVLISPKERQRKPYAIPIQLIPYVGINQAGIRRIVSNVAQKMKARGMKVAGFVANGEYNGLRSMGYKRAVNVLKIKSDVRGKYSRMGENNMFKMINPIENPDGTVSAEHPNSPIPVDVLREVLEMKKKGTSIEDIISRLRPRTVPTGYPIHTWKEGEPETTLDQLRSVLAQFEFRYTVRSWDQRGVPFCAFMYVPEIHPVLGTEFHEREDEGHVLKRIGQSTRRGGPDALKMERFTEALYDEQTQLTYPALTGQRKQSIRDVEVLFSKGVEEFMARKGYTYEARFVRTIRQWRQACDERGLTQLKRCRYNYKFLNLILGELMPWYNESYDFSLLEVNQPVKGVLGFTRETVIAVTTNIESREWRRRQPHGVENPRSSTTDDVECFFSLLRDLAGKHFTLRQATNNWRKVCMEFTKRLDPALPFFYHTSSHDRFYEGERPSFDLPGKSKFNPRRQRVRTKEQFSRLTFGRITLPTPSESSIRSKHHNVPTDMIPPPTRANPLSDHNYFA